MKLKNRKQIMQDLAIMRDLEYVCERLEWQSDVGDRQAQERMTVLHSGRYGGDRRGFFVQTSNAIDRLSLLGKP